MELHLNGEVRMGQGILPVEIVASPRKAGVTALAGLSAYLELVVVSGLVCSTRRRLRSLAQSQGWWSWQHVVSLILLNLAGGECVDDMRILEGDSGVGEMWGLFERHVKSRRERQEAGFRWRKPRRRVFPSASSVLRFLSLFHDSGVCADRGLGKAFVPPLSEGLAGLGRVNGDLVAFAQSVRPMSVATLDMDATLVETWKQGALPSYKGFRAYQPLNTYWFEQGLVVHSEFRDGNVPAGWEQLRVFRDVLAGLPVGVRKVYLRSDTAAYQSDLLRYCACGKDPRFGVIEFAVGCPVNDEFRRAVAAVPDGEWRRIRVRVNGRMVPSVHEWAEVVFVPGWTARSRNDPEFRFVAIRERLVQEPLPEMREQLSLPFATMEMGAKAVLYKLHGLVTNRAEPGEEIVRWYWERCGKSEEVHAIQKLDMAGGQFPSGDFGENAAWWHIMILAMNLNAIMQRRVLPLEYGSCRMKSLRFRLIGIAGVVIRHARRVLLRLFADAKAVSALIDARAVIRTFAPPARA